MIASDRRLIEDYLPVDRLSAEASGEPRTKRTHLDPASLASAASARRLPGRRIAPAARPWRRTYPGQ